MKAKRFLISIERKEAIAPRKAYQRGYPTISELTHTRHITVTSHNPEQLAIDYAQAHKSEVISVAPVKHKKQRAKLITTRAKSDDDMERTAGEYARWLAQRDGIAIPANCNRTVAEWSGVHTNRVSKSGRGIFERRICAVRFVGHATTGPRIEIPNWDWQPAEPVEIIEDQPELPSAPMFVDISAISEYGMTQKLSNSIRCF